MRLTEIPVPEVYLESQDFRFFLDWFETSLTKTQYDIENLFDLYDPLRCPQDLLWLLADTMGFKYDGRLPTSYNRLVLLYFMSMIRNRGSKDGVVLAAEVNLAQFNILLQGQSDENLYNRLDDTSIPVNSVYVTPHTEYGFIDVVYFSSEIPLDACIEYVRPVGMFLFQHAGVRFDARTKISVDARLTDSRDVGMSFGPTYVGNYSRKDFATMQKSYQRSGVVQNDTTDTRGAVWSRNSASEVSKDTTINPGYRALNSLQLCNNEEITRALIDSSNSSQPIFSIGYGPQDIGVTYPDSYLKAASAMFKQDGDYTKGRPIYQDTVYPGKEPWNLRLHCQLEAEISESLWTNDEDRSPDILTPRPAVNPIMAQLGDAISMNEYNSTYTKTMSDGTVGLEDV